LAREPSSCQKVVKQLCIGDYWLFSESAGAKCNGIFFYFQAPRADGQGKRHLWRYIDAATH
jgi:hypothetical protein